jgi:hypothetical protein
MKESNDAVKDAMIANGYNSLIGWIDQDVKDAGRELVIYESTQPTEVKEVVNEITIPTRSNKKEAYKVKLTNGDTETREGYKINISEFPDTKFYIHRLPNKTYSIDDATTGFIFPIRNIYGNTIEGVIKEFTETVNKYSKKPDTLKVLQTTGLFVTTQPTEGSTTQPAGVKPVGEKSSISDDMAEYTKLVEQNNGAQPKTFTVGNRTWTLNKFQNYDWSDPTTGQIYMRNVNMETGLSEEEAGMNEPVDPALIEQSLNYIDSNRKLLALDHKFADMGYDINDIIRDLIEAKTMQDYFNVKEKLDKLC